MRFKQQTPKPQRGFTLVELLTVITIIGVLATVVIFIINPVTVQQRARDAVRLSDLVNLQQAIEAFMVDRNNTLPDAQAQFTTRRSDILPSGNAGPTVMSNGEGWIDEDLSGYLPKLMVDPLNRTLQDIDYVYRYRQDGLKYKLDAALEYEGNQSMAQNDGGTDVAHYERGTGLDIEM